MTKISNSIIVGTILITGILLGSFASVLAVPTNTVTTITKWAGINTCTYKFFESGGTYYAQSCDSGSIVYSGTDASVVVQSAIDSITTSGTLFFKEGRYELETNSIILNKPLAIEGSPGTIFDKTGNYVGQQRSIFSIRASDITIRNVELVDTFEHSDTKLIVLQPTTNVKNILLENVKVHNAGWQAIVLSNVNNVIADGITLDRVTVNVTNRADGVGLLIGKGVRNIVVQNSNFIDSGCAGISVWGAEENISILNNYVNKTVNTSCMGIVVTNYRDILTEWGHVKNVLIQGNKVYGPIQFDAITVYGEADKVVVADNFIEKPTRDGIKVAFNAVEGSNKYSKEVLVRNNIVFNPTGIGISVNANITKDFQAISIIGNLVKEPRSHGISIDSTHGAIVSNNQIYHAGLAGTANNAAINVANANASQIFGNQVYSNSSLTWSVRESGSAGAYKNRIHDNTVDKPISIIGTATSIYNNEGFVTEAEGTATIGSAGNVNVTHGLSYTPAATEITWTFTENPDTSVGVCWAEGITSTQFRIKCEVAPGASNLDLSWMVRRLG